MTQVRSIRETFKISVAAPSFNAQELLTRLKAAENRPKNKTVKIRECDIRALCTQAQASFLAEPTLLEVDGPIKLCGDIHGQFYDLLKLFSHCGQPPKTRYLFLGDYVSLINLNVDRGENSLETICMLLSLKVSHPRSFFMIRGNHESTSVNRKYGFLAELRTRFNENHQTIFELFNRTFDHMPLAAVVNRQIFCCHGGLSPNLIDIDQIRQLARPMTVPPDNWVTDILWSDPDEDIDGFEKMNNRKLNKKHRGKGHLFGQDALEIFLEDNDLIMVVRAHQCIENGYRWSFERQLVTLFSAPNYKQKNVGAVMRVSQQGGIGFHRFK